MLEAWAGACVDPNRVISFPDCGRKRETKMQTLHRNEHYTDRGHYAVMTRTAVIKDAQLARIADHLRRNAEDLTGSSNPPTIDNCRIAGAMLGWAFSLAPIRIVVKFDY
jgi:hypothetical protein